MKVFFDTTALIDLERCKDSAIKLVRLLSREDVPLLISIVTITELLAGAHSSREASKNVIRAKELLAEFNWIELDGRTAENIAILLAYRNKIGQPVDYTDAAIAGSFLTSGSDFLITDNKKDFEFPQLKGKVYTPKEFLNAWKTKELKFV